MFEFDTLDDVDVSGARVLVRSDLNVPLDDGSVSDDFRIRAAIPTLDRLRESGAIVAVCSHLGRPKGADPQFSMSPVAERLRALSGWPVTMVPAVVGGTVDAAVESARPGDVMVLENTRFEAGEKQNDPDLAATLAAPFDLFVQDAFGSVHRAHASTVGVAERIRSVAGPVLEREVRSLQRFLGDPDRPYVVILGGSKISDKLGVMKHLLPRVDAMLVGGGMCFTALVAQGIDVGESLVEHDMVDEVGSLLDGAHGAKLHLPTDLVVADRFAEDAEADTVAVDEVPPGWMGLDIGPETAATFAGVVDGAANVFWNGPMGVFEWECFRAGTARIAEAMADTDAYTAVGGGDSAAALRLLGREDDVSHLSTGGGAGLELLEGKELPGVAVLERWTTHG